MTQEKSPVLEHVISFDNSRNNITDEEIVYNSNIKTNLPLETLINNSETTRLAKRNKKKGISNIPRRQNTWIIYRRDKNEIIKSWGLKLKPYMISELISKMWRDETKEVKEFYAAISRLSIKNHIKKYGSDYKYQPKPTKKSKNKQKKSKPVSSPATSNSSFEESPFNHSLPTPMASNENSPLTSLPSKFEEISPNLLESVMNMNLYDNNLESAINEDLQFFPPLSAISATPASLESEGQLSNSSSEPGNGLQNNFGEEQAFPPQFNLGLHNTLMTMSSFGFEGPSDDEESLSATMDNFNQSLPTPMMSNENSPLISLPLEFSPNLLVMNTSLYENNLANLSPNFLDQLLPLESEEQSPDYLSELEKFLPPQFNSGSPANNSLTTMPSFGFDGQIQDNAYIGFQPIISTQQQYNGLLFHHDQIDQVDQMDQVDFS